MSDAQTSSRRAQPNLENSRRSTGPKRTEKTCYNALKQGLRARSPILPDEDSEALRARHEAFSASVAPRDEVERLLVERLVRISWRLQRVDRALAARSAEPDPDEAARLAEEADFVALMGRRLMRDPRGPTCFYPRWETTLGKIPRLSWTEELDDPNDPARIVIALEARALGCAWLLDRFAELRGLLDDGLPWQPHDQFKAVRLLGRQPIDAVDDRRVILIYLACWAMNEEGGYPLQGVATELDNAEKKRFIALLNDRKVVRLKPADAEAAEAQLRSLIDAEESRLEGILAGHLARAEAAAAARAAHDPSPEAERLRRDEQACDRALVRIIEALRKRRRQAGGPNGPGRGTGGKKGETTQDPARKLGLLVDLLAPYDGEWEANGVARPAPTRPPEPARPSRSGHSRGAGSSWMMPAGMSVHPAASPAETRLPTSARAGCWPARAGLAIISTAWGRRSAPDQRAGGRQTVSGAAMEGSACGGSTTSASSPTSSSRARSMSPRPGSM